MVDVTADIMHAEEEQQLVEITTEEDQPTNRLVSTKCGPH